MGYTLAEDYLRVDVADRSSLFFRISGGIRQVVATGEEARDALTEIWGQPHGLDDNGNPLWQIGD